MDRLILKLFTCLIFIIIFESCKNKNDFKYQGEYPKWDYINFRKQIEQEELYDKIDTNTTAFRDRIYVTIDNSLNLYLNGHKIMFNEFEDHFKFIYTNPQKLKHLPENCKNIMIYYAVNLPSEKNDKEFEISTKVQNVILDLQKKYSLQMYGKTIAKLDSIQRLNVQKEYPLNIAVYSPSFEKIDRGILDMLEIVPLKKDDSKETIYVEIYVKRKNVLFQGKKIKVNDIADSVKVLIKPFLIENSKKIILSLENDEDANYNLYKEAMRNTKELYKQLLDNKAHELYRKSYINLNNKEKRKTRSEVPLTLK